MVAATGEERTAPDDGMGDAYSRGARADRQGSHPVTDAELIARMVDRRVDELCSLAYSAGLEIDARRHDMRAIELAKIASDIRSGKWRERT